VASPKVRVLRCSRRRYSSHARAACSAALLGALLLGAPAGLASTRHHAVVGDTVQVVGLPAESSTISVLVRQAWNHVGIPKHIRLYAIGQFAVKGNAATIRVPVSERLADIAHTMHGIVNLVIVVRSPSRTYQWMLPARVQHNRLLLSTKLPSVTKWAWFETISTARPDYPCEYRTINTWENYTQLGELHVANVTDASAKYEDITTADNSISVGYSGSGDNGSFTGDGTLTLSNSIGTDGYINRGSGYHKNVRGHIYYDEVQFYAGTCPYGYGYYIFPESSVGDVTDGVDDAPVNPYGSCGADPNGDATVGPNGGWGRDRSSARTYDGATNILGFSISSENGFTTDVNESWTAGATATYVCGDQSPVQYSGVFWNDGH